MELPYFKATPIILKFYSNFTKLLIFGSDFIAKTWDILN